MADPKFTYTIRNFIEAGGTVKLSYANLSFTDVLGDIKYPVANVLDDYISDLKAQAIDITLSDNEFLKYIYKPKLLASDLYGNPELYFVIMALNGICNVKEFNTKYIKLLKVEDMDKFLNSIFNIESASLQIFNNKKQ